MGQILGGGYQAGDRSKATTSVNFPSDVRSALGNVTGLQRAGAPAYQNLLVGGVSGDRSVLTPYVSSLASTYQDIVPQAFTPATAAYTAPFQQQIQQAQGQIRRATPAGGGQTQGIAQANMQGAISMGAARAQQAQRDMEQLAALKLMNANNKNQLAMMDVSNQDQLMQRLMQTYGAIFGGFNPMAQAGSTQKSSTPGRLGFPGWEMLV